MLRTQVLLTDSEPGTLDAVVAGTGQSIFTLIRQAVDTPSTALRSSEDDIAADTPSGVEGRVGVRYVV